MSGLQWSLIQLAMLLLMAVISLQKMKKVVRQGYLWKGPGEIMSRLNGTTINAQGNQSSSNTPPRQFLLKRVVYCRVLTVMQPTTSPLLTQILLNGGIEKTIVTAGNKTGIHTVNLNIKDG